VAVPCPRCGREYDATRFESGRTLWCTCGARVGATPRVRSLGGPETRFLADAMLGRLARWLRTLGFDCAYAGEIGDEELVARAAREERVLLSRDRALPEEWRIAGIHLVGSEDLREQLREILRRFDLADSVRLFSRCNACNSRLREAQKIEVSQRVPPHVLATHERFLECPGCRRVYWEGSHARRIRRFADEVLGDEPAEPSAEPAQRSAGQRG
jgi:uncharacterized protein with PIN domain